VSGPLGAVGAVAAIEAALLRAGMPDLPLRQGATFLARVASRGERGSASLVIAGELVPARVPEEVRKGDTLRLAVAEVTADRVLLRIEAPPPAPAPAPPPPDAPRVTVEERPEGRGGGPGDCPAVLVLSYETPTLGRLGIRLESAGGAVTAAIEVPPGLLELASARAGELGDGLTESTGRPSTVRIAARREALDLYA
jgi:hypothetical protein